MRLDHIAYRVKDREKSAQFFVDAFGYKKQIEFDITLEDGSTAKCVALEPPEKVSPSMAFVSEVDILGIDVASETGYSNTVSAYHLAPEIFVSSGPPGSLIDKWVEEWGRGVGGIHHMAYQVDSVEAKMKEWIDKGWMFTTKEALKCESLTQVFSKPHPLTGMIYEFIERKGQHGFCKDNVAKLMASTANLK